MRRGEQYLTYEQLTAKLDKYQELRAAAAAGWTARANAVDVIRQGSISFWVDVRENGDVRFSAANAIEDVASMAWRIRCKYTGPRRPKRRRRRAPGRARASREDRTRAVGTGPNRCSSWC